MGITSGSSRDGMWSDGSLTPPPTHTHTAASKAPVLIKQILAPQMNRRSTLSPGQVFTVESARVSGEECQNASSVWRRRHKDVPSF